MNTLKKTKSIFISLLLSATALSAPVAIADDDNQEALEKRVAELEAMVKLLVGKLDTQEIAVSEQRKRLQAAEPLIAQAAENAKTAQNNKSASKDGFTIGNTHVDYGGYIKADVIALKNTGGALAPSSNIARDFFIPSTIPVGGNSSDLGLDFSARETRFYFATKTQVAGETLGTRLEFDFNVTGDGNERISNTFTPRMRHAFITYKGWLFGQAWSTFLNVGSLPDALDFIGSTEGTPFARQPMIRYTKGPFQIALEQPETTITTATGGRVLSGNDPLPDLIVRYNQTGAWGQVSFSGIARNLKAGANIAGLNADASALGIGGSIAGKFKVGAKDDFRFAATYGTGLGRYIALNAVNDVVVNPATNDVETIATFSSFAAYRHYWQDDWRSSAMFSYFKADNPVSLTSAGVTDELWSIRSNLVYSPFPKLDIGVEYGYSRRKIESGLSGGQHRIQFSTQFSF